MALVLGVKIGDVVDIAANWVAVLSVDSRSSATLIGNDGERITISAAYETEMAPGVWVSLGADPGRSRLRLKFEAPRHIPISRRPSQLADQHEPSGADVRKGRSRKSDTFRRSVS
jgi:hypothetical protein